MDDLQSVEQFFATISTNRLDQLKGPEFHRVHVFLDDELPVLLKNSPHWLVAHPRYARKCLELCQWARGRGFERYRMVEYALHLRCILAVAEARRLNLQSAQHEILLAAGMEDDRADKSSIPDVAPFHSLLKNGQLSNAVLPPLFQAVIQNADCDSQKLKTIVQTLEDLLYTIAEDEKRSGVVKGLFVVGDSRQGRLRNVLVKVTHRPESKPVEIRYSSLAREQVQSTLENAAHVAASVAHEFLIQQGFPEGLSGRIVAWQIVLPTGKVEDCSVKYDGESLGLPLAMAIVSDYIGEPVPADLAFTGAFDLLGSRESVVLGVGGIPQKINAALESGVKRIYIPEINMDDVDVAAEKEAERIHAKIVPVHSFALLCQKHVPLIGQQESNSFLQILQKSLVSLPIFFYGKDETVPRHHRIHVYLASILFTLLIAVEALGFHFTFPESATHSQAIPIIVAIVVTTFLVSILSHVTAYPFLNGKNPWGWVASITGMKIVVLAMGALICTYVPFRYDLSKLPDWPQPVNVMKDLFILWLFAALYPLNLFHYVMGLEYLLKKRQFFTVKACLEGESRVSAPNYVIGIRWDAAVYAAAIVGAFLLVLEMIYFLNINDDDSRALFSVFYLLARDFIFIVLGVEVLVWYKLALDRVKGELEKSCAEG